MVYFLFFFFFSSYTQHTHTQRQQQCDGSPSPDTSASTSVNRHADATTSPPLQQQQQGGLVLSAVEHAIDRAAAPDLILSNFVMVTAAAVASARSMDGGSDGAGFSAAVGHRFSNASSLSASPHFLPSLHHVSGGDGGGAAYLSLPAAGGEGGGDSSPLITLVQTADDTVGNATESGGGCGAGSRSGSRSSGHPNMSNTADDARFMFYGMIEPHDIFTMHVVRNPARVESIVFARDGGHGRAR